MTENPSTSWGSQVCAWHEVIWTQKTPELPASAFALPTALGAEGSVLACAGAVVAASWKPWAVVPEGSRAPPAAPSLKGSWQPRNHPSGAAQFCRAVATPGCMSQCSELKTTARRRELEYSVFPKATSLAPFLCRTAPGEGV